MASSLNGLTVGDPLPDNLMDSPARSESMFYLRYFYFDPVPFEVKQWYFCCLYIDVW